MPCLNWFLSIPLVLCTVCLAPAAIAAPAIAAGVAAPKITPGATPALKEVAVELELIRVLAVSQADGRAVLAFPDGIMVAAQTGDVVPRTGAVLKQVLLEKIVLEQGTPGRAGKQLIWMHKAQGNKPGRVERFSSLAEPAPVAPAPVSRILLPQPARKP